MGMKGLKLCVLFLQPVLTNFIILFIVLFCTQDQLMIFLVSQARNNSNYNKLYLCWGTQWTLFHMNDFKNRHCVKLYKLYKGLSLILTNKNSFIMTIMYLLIRTVLFKLLYDKPYFLAVFVTKTIFTSTWDCTPDRIYGK
jgi:hypothetical protein